MLVPHPPPEMLRAARPSQVQHWHRAWHTGSEAQNTIFQQVPFIHPAFIMPSTVRDTGDTARENAGLSPVLWVLDMLVG